MGQGITGFRGEQRRENIRRTPRNVILSCILEPGRGNAVAKTYAAKPLDCCYEPAITRMPNGRSLPEGRKDWHVCTGGYTTEIVAFQNELL